MGAELLLCKPDQALFKVDRLILSGFQSAAHRNRAGKRHPADAGLDKAGSIRGDNRSVDPLIAVDQVHDLLIGGGCLLAEILCGQALTGGFVFVSALAVNQFDLGDFVIDRVLY